MAYKSRTKSRSTKIPTFDFHFLYIIFDQKTGLTKIGITGNPKARVTHFLEDYGPQIKVKYMFCFETKEEAQKREKALHKEFGARNVCPPAWKKNKLSGYTEWFQLGNYATSALVKRENNREFSMVYFLFAWIFVAFVKGKKKKYAKFY